MPSATQLPPEQLHECARARALTGRGGVQVLALQGAVPRTHVRDTALYAPLMSRHPVSGKLRSRRLRHVVQQELQVDIQQGEHDPGQDARAALYVYHKHRCVPEHRHRVLLLQQRNFDRAFDHGTDSFSVEYIRDVKQWNESNPPVLPVAGSVRPRICLLTAASDSPSDYVGFARLSVSDGVTGPELWSAWVECGMESAHTRCPAVTPRVNPTQG